MKLGALSLIAVLQTITTGTYQALTSASMLWWVLSELPRGVLTAALWVGSRCHQTHFTQELTAFLAVELKITRLLNLNSDSSLRSAEIITYRAFSPCTTAESTGVSTPALLTWSHRSPRSWGWCLQRYVATGSRGWGWSTRPLRGTASADPGLHGDLNDLWYHEGPCGYICLSLNWW